MSVNQKLTNWVRIQILSISERRGRCTELILRHLYKKGEDVETWEIQPNPREEDAESLADIIDLAALEDANGIGGLQKYSVSSYFEKNPGRVGARFVFRQIGTDEADDDNPSEESDVGRTSNTAVMGMLVRHTERLHNMLLSSTSNTINNQARTIEGYQKQESEMMRMKMELFDTLQDSKDRKKQRKLEKRNQEFKEEAIRDTLSKVLMIAPHVVNKVAGKKLLPEPAAALSSLGELRKNLTPEEIGKIAACLPPDKQIAFFEVLSSLDDEEEPKKSNGTAKGKA